MTVAPYGSWPSPVSAASLVEQAVSLSQVRVNGAGVWWVEGRPQEGGRNVVVRDGIDVVPAGFSSRNRVHEYGGGAYTVHGSTLFFSNDADQRLWRVDVDGPDAPIALTPDDGTRYADADVSPDGRWLACVREQGLVNDLVLVAADGEAPPRVVASGHDFYAAPRWSPDGSQFAWLSWDHPNMPWDGTDLWLANADALAAARHLAGGPDESVSQPRWSPAGVVHWISDRTGWWNLYAGPDARPVAPMDADCARPDWVFGQSSYTFLPDGRVVLTWFEDGLSRLGVAEGGGVRGLDLPFTDISALQAASGTAVTIAASGRRAQAVVAINVDTGTHRIIKASQPTALADGVISEARPIEFPTTGGRTAHAFYYRPRLEGYEGLPTEKPPLLVRSHGGPTSAASPAFNPEIQFWTSRGIAVVDVNYGGSSGYGRDYRRRLDGQWGVVDVDDCASAARHLAGPEAGEVDPARLLVRGGSAGGYTTLCLLAFRDEFAAGASYYGVADLETLATDTHKFEARYLDRLIGPYPAASDLYRARSPLHAADRIAVPVILFQGLEDAVVPPSQAEALAAALRRKEIPFAYVAFEGEQHGFRRGETIVRAFEAELWFYGRVLGFRPADAIEPVPVEGELP